MRLLAGATAVRRRAASRAGLAKPGRRPSRSTTRRGPRRALDPTPGPGVGRRRAPRALEVLVVAVEPLVTVELGGLLRADVAREYAFAAASVVGTPGVGREPRPPEDAKRLVEVARLTGPPSTVA